MPLSLIPIRRLDPDVRLAQAVSEFKATLSSEQKAKLQQNPGHAPGPEDVVNLMAEVNQAVLEKGSGRCYSTRLRKFLAGVQQFASIGDVVIGGSQFLPACAAWSLVRFSLLSIVKFTTYTDDMTALFMEIGRNMPLMQDMALLFPHSRQLQDRTTEYLTLVVETCHKMLQHSRDSHLKQFFRSLSNSTADIRKLLEDCSLAIHREMAITRTKVAQTSDRHTRKHRERSSKLRMLEACSRFDYVTSRSQYLAFGNTTLLQHISESRNSLYEGYKKWRSQADASTLVLAGRLGSGKSVLLAHVVDDLFRVGAANTQVAYFFCRYDEPESLKARIILGSLFKQIITPLDLSSIGDDLDHSPLAVDEMLAIFRKAWRPSAKLYVVVDGLYECEIKDIKQVLKIITDLQKEYQLHVCISVRNSFQEGLIGFSSQIHVNMPTSNPDIELFLEDELESLVLNQQLSFRDPTVPKKIKDTLVEKSEGMFLWVWLQLPILCSQSSDGAIFSALQDMILPDDLASIYHRLLSSSLNNVSQRQRFLSLIIAAYRNLSIEEIQECLSVEPGRTSWDKSKYLSDLTSIFCACKGLVILDELTRTVRLVHSSALDYLCSGRYQAFDDIHGQMCEIVATYLNFPEFENQISTTVVPTIHAHMLPAGITTTVLASHPNVIPLALKFLKPHKSRKVDVTNTIAEHKLRNTTVISAFVFQDYAREFWLKHFCDAENISEKTYRLVLRLVQSRRVVLQDSFLFDAAFWQTRTKPADHLSPLIRAVYEGKRQLVRLMLDSALEDPNGNPKSDLHPVEAAISQNNCEILQILLSHEKIDCDWGPDVRFVYASWFTSISALYRTHPFEIILNAGQTDLARIMLHSGHISQERIDYLLRKNLPTLVKGCSVSFLRLLLDSSVGQLQLANANRESLVSIAANAGNIPVVKFLLNRGAKVELTSAIMALEAAERSDFEEQEKRDIKNAHIQIVMAMLSCTSLKPNQKSIDGYTALALVIIFGFRWITEALLDLPSVSFFNRDSEGRTELQIAVIHNREEVVRKMLAHCNVMSRHRFDKGLGSRDHKGCNALDHALTQGNASVEKMLRDAISKSKHKSGTQTSSSQPAEADIVDAVVQETTQPNHEHRNNSNRSVLDDSTIGLAL